MIILNNTTELTAFLNNNDLPSLVGVVSFSGDLLAMARATGFNQISIDEEIGFCDDGGWIEVDEAGMVVDDAYLP